MSRLHIPLKLGQFLAIAIVSLVAVLAHASRAEGELVSAAEEQRKNELRSRLCKQAELDCQYVTSIFGDPRLEIYEPPAPEERPSRPQKEKEKNPYLTKRFGLLTPESVGRCISFMNAHSRTFAAAYDRYGVSKEIICGHLRIETDFGIPTKLSPHPLGTRPAISQLISLYVRNPSPGEEETRFVRRQEFAFAEISRLIASGKRCGWDLFEIPGSPTGAIGLVQFEPSSLGAAVDGNGDGRIDMFDPDDAILSVAHYLITRGWDRNPEHQRRAIYAYYGGAYDRDPHKYYMKAVLKYASQVRIYLRDHPPKRAGPSPRRIAQAGGEGWPADRQ